MAGKLNSATKYVASRTLDEVEWSNSILLEGDVAEQVARLKDEDGPEIQVHGSWDLIQTLLEHDLVDEYRLWIFPVVLGSGKRLFGDGTIPKGLRLSGSTTSGPGVVLPPIAHLRRSLPEPNQGHIAGESTTSTTQHNRVGGVDEVTASTHSTVAEGIAAAGSFVTSV
jgi:hypothetical protein